MQVRPGNGHVGTSMSDIDEPIVLHKVRFKLIPGRAVLT